MSPIRGVHRQDLDIGKPGGVIDGDLDEVPADATALALAGPVPGDPVTDPLETTALLDVDTDQFAGSLALIAPWLLLRLERFESSDPCLPHPAGDGRSGEMQPLSDLGADEPARITAALDRLDCLISELQGSTGAGSNIALGQIVRRVDLTETELAVEIDLSAIIDITWQPEETIGLIFEVTVPTPSRGPCANRIPRTHE